MKFIENYNKEMFGNNFEVKNVCPKSNMYNFTLNKEIFQILRIHIFYPQSVKNRFTYLQKYMIYKGFC